MKNEIRKLQKEIRELSKEIMDKGIENENNFLMKRLRKRQEKYIKIVKVYKKKKLTLNYDLME